MNISDFAVNQLADQNLGTFANGPRCSKNYAAFSVSPPTAWNRFSGNRLCEVGHWTTSGLEHYSVPLHESGCFSRTQISLSNFEFALQACLPPMLVALLEPDVAFAVPVDQRAGCLALTHEKRVSAKMWDACFTRRVAGTLF